MSFRFWRKQRLATDQMGHSAQVVLARLVANLADAQPVVAEAFSAQPTTDVTAPQTWSVDSGALPPGLSLNTSTGEITGTPTNDGLADQGLWVFQLAVTGGNGSALTPPVTYAVQGVELPNTVANGGTLAWYSKMDDDPSGGVLTDAVAGNDGAFNGTPTQVPGAVDFAIFFENDNDDWAFVDTSVMPAIGTSDYTCVFTVSREAGSSSVTQVTKRDSFELFFPGVQFFVSDTLATVLHNGGGAPVRLSISAAHASIDGTGFHNFVFSGDRDADLTIYVDGVVSGSGAISSQPDSVDSPANWIVGGITSDGVEEPRGDAALDEVALFLSALDADQAATCAWLSRTGVSIQDWIGF